MILKPTVADMYFDVSLLHALNRVTSNTLKYTIIRNTRRFNNTSCAQLEAELTFTNLSSIRSITIFFLPVARKENKGIDSTSKLVNYETSKLENSLLVVSLTPACLRLVLLLNCFLAGGFYQS